MRWVYAPDGTLQCGLGREVELQEMGAALSRLIGGGKILAQEKRLKPGLRPSVCGAPTGWVNAYALDDEGYRAFTWGFTGQPPAGWFILDFGDAAASRRDDGLTSAYPLPGSGEDRASASDDQAGRIHPQGPEVPFRGVPIAELLCRDCGFPMKPSARVDIAPPSRSPQREHGHRDGTGDDRLSETRDFEAAIITQLLRQSTSAARMPAMIRDLIGFRLRVATPTSVGTMDYDENRVNVHVDDEWIISDVSYG